MQNNLCKFIGRLASEPEFKYLKNGKEMVSFTLACSDSYIDKNTKELIETVYYPRFSCFGGISDRIKNLKKGEQVYVESKYTTSTSGEGENKKFFHNFIVSDIAKIKFLEKEDVNSNQEEYQQYSNDNLPF